MFQFYLRDAFSNSFQVMIGRILYLTLLIHYVRIRGVLDECGLFSRVGLVARVFVNPLFCRTLEPFDL
ncbi:hypothetical protein OI69_03165 [Pectobacterium fontis]|uniref:Uncharacterized protein n=1 Tax=Pectobacterium fontis TaxID=2558042 RepID=A0A7V8IMY1_9GAMM|nr:hypothetical protein OI69_03165 [Pectobacterium fontis]